MENRTNPNVDPLEAAKHLFDLRQILVGSHGILGRVPLLRLGSADHIDAVQSRFLLNGRLIALPEKRTVFNVQDEVFPHLVPVDDFPYFQGDFTHNYGQPIGGTSD